ncbi:unnamed protein product [Parnassius apollo]|uniref:(apollo) hypothetical protein n=1 Tax=Parnassius apollo TaxID=110799 RepID=A0A8S3WIK8_PARAO|nr:unnamed protein product [Parnassius apollo]
MNKGYYLSVESISAAAGETSGVRAPGSLRRRVASQRRRAAESGSEAASPAANPPRDRIPRPYLSTVSRTPLPASLGARNAPISFQEAVSSCLYFSSSGITLGNCSVRGRAHGKWLLIGLLPPECL